MPLDAAGAALASPDVSTPPGDAPAAPAAAKPPPVRRRLAKPVKRRKVAKWGTLRIKPGKPAPGPAWVSAAKLIDGFLAIEVALQGTLGIGKTMLVDDCAWARVKALHGDKWGLAEKKGHHYVMSMGAKPRAVLARVIAWAQPDQAVRYRNGNTLDVRRSNLVVQSAAEATQEALGGRKAA